MGLMSLRRFVLAALVLVCSVAGGALGLAPVAAAESCPNAVSRQGASALLPDCRAYELVTPVNKGVAEDMFGEEEPFPSEAQGEPEGVHPEARVASSEDGDEFLLDTLAGFGGNAAAGLGSYVFTRGVDGWSAVSAASPGLGAQSLEVNVFSPDFSEVAFEDVVPAKEGDVEPGQKPENRVFQLVGPPGGPYTTIQQGLPYGPTKAEVVGASADLGHVVIATDDRGAAPGDTGQEAGRALYDWNGGQLRLVNVNSDGSLVSLCGASLGLGTHYDQAGGHNMVSSDGSKIFFTAPDPEVGASEIEEGPPGAGCPGEDPPQLYMRVDGSRTVELSAPDPGVVDPDGQRPAMVAGATADGSRVFFLTSTELTPDDVGLHGMELYEYDTVTSTLTRVSRGDSGHAEGNAGAVVAISGDGSTVYFLASGQLAPGAPVGGGLYRYDTATETTTFVTNGVIYAQGHEPWPWYTDHNILAGQPGLSMRAPYYTTANGDFLLFGSTADITGYDPQGHEELYRYDAVDGSIVCVSCDPSGAPPTESAEFTRSYDEFDHEGLAPRPISEDGSYVFFDTSSTLVPQASRGVIHVYEWHNGAISLIGAPSDPVDSFFLGSSADGSNVFFGTHAQLVPQDGDRAGDVYDARIDGGFEGVAPPACTGTGCQGVPSVPPLFATPASVTFNGPGNLTPPAPAAKPAVKPKPKSRSVKCGRGYVKKRDKCVRKPRAKAKKSAKGRK
jgi:hypothetical protein